MSDRGEAGRVDYSIVIPAYNEEAFLPATLGAIAAARAGEGGRAGEVIVVDNNSTDATAEVARARGARVVFEGVNQISRARNAGAAAARGRYLIFVDADTRISPELLRATLEALDSGEVCGGGAAVAYDQSARRSARWLVRIWNAYSRRRRMAAGSYVYCLREAFEAVGGFDESVYYSEEILFSRACKRWGRGRGMRFEILPEPVETSYRKFDWFSPSQVILPLIFFWFWRKRPGRCGVWYRRPEG